jgi:putative phosphoribosyl transferase
MSVRVPAGEAQLDGDLELAGEASGIVLFAHGSGSSRFSPRNRWVAERLRGAGLATLLMDLLTPDEAARDELTGEHRFDVALLGRRLVAALDWLSSDGRTAALPVGIFGASTGAAGALIAAAERPDPVRAVVSRGGRPDLAGEALGKVTAPTLLVVGGEDHVVIRLNREAAAQLRAPHRLEIVPGATHLFEEPGALKRVAELASRWFGEHLRVPQA